MKNQPTQFPLAYANFGLKPTLNLTPFVQATPGGCNRRNGTGHRDPAAFAAPHRGLSRLIPAPARSGGSLTVLVHYHRPSQMPMHP